MLTVAIAPCSVTIYLYAAVAPCSVTVYLYAAVDLSHHRLEVVLVGAGYQHEGADRVRRLRGLLLRVCVRLRCVRGKEFRVHTDERLIQILSLIPEFCLICFWIGKRCRADLQCGGCAWEDRVIVTVVRVIQVHNEWAPYCRLETAAEEHRCSSTHVCGMVCKMDRRMMD